MNPQATRTTTIGPDPVFFTLGVPMSRFSIPEKPSKPAPIRDGNVVVEAGMAQQEREEALTFLHRLVMG